MIMAKMTADMAQSLPQQRCMKQLAKDLFVLSRFNRYNPLLATFSGVWATLLAGASKIAYNPGSTTPTYVFEQALLCFVSGYVFCGAGMVWNDLIDLRIDQQVARTKNRPLAAGRVTTSEALLWMMVQYVASWYMVSYMLDGQNVIEAIIPVTLSTLLYPFGKRAFFRRLGIYPQYFLGFTLGWPSVIGCLAIKGQDQPLKNSVSESLALGITVFAWVLYLNTAYSYQDVEDDKKANVNSVYVLAGSYIHYFLIFLASLVLGATSLQLHAQDSQWLWGSWMCVWSYSFAHQLMRFNAKDPGSGGSLHKENFALGIWTIFACAVELVLKS